MSQTLGTTIGAVLVAGMSAAIARLTEPWSLGAPVELAALVLSVFLYYAINAATSRRNEVGSTTAMDLADPQKELELLEKRWDVYGKTAFVFSMAGLIIVFFAVLVAGLLYRLWIWIIP